MKYLPIFFCLLNLAFAVREKQIRLEDIEKDNLASERQVQQQSKIKEQPPVPQQYISPPQPTLRLQPHYRPEYFQQALSQLPQFPQFQHFPQLQQLPQIQQQQHLQQQPQQHQSKIAAPKLPITPPRFQFGFRPMKTQQAQSIGKPNTQQYNSASLQQHSLPQQILSYQPTQLYQQQLPQQHLPPSKAQQYVQSQPQYQQFDLPYITDNNLNAQDTSAAQQYYTPQLYYVQQYPSASNSIQTVVDPKGGVQYVMYLPPPYLQGAQAEQTQAVETLSQPQSQIFDQQQQNYNSIQGLPGGEQQQYQYVELPQAQLQIQPEAQVAPQAQKYSEIQYVPQQQAEIIQQAVPKFEFAQQQKYAPKSLLDSYVPSLLQIQYYKQQQQQAQANAIPQSLKLQQPIIGKGGYNKDYAPQAAASAQSFNYQYNQYSSHPAHGQRVKQ